MSKGNDSNLLSRGDLVEWRDIDANIYSASGLIPKEKYNGTVVIGGTKFTRYQGYITEVLDDVATVLISFEMENVSWVSYGKRHTSLTEFKAIALPKPEIAKYPLIMLRLIKKQALE